MSTTATKPRRRFFQFSLKALMLLVVVAAVPCGWLKWKMDQKRRERAAVTEIKRVGGDTRYDWEIPFGSANARPPGAAWQRRLLGDDFFASVSFAHLSSDEIGDEWLLHLEPLTELTSLYFGHRGRNTNITDDGVQYLTRFKKLVRLGLDGTGMTDAGLVHLKSLTRLQWLDIRDTAVTDAGLGHIEPLTGLRLLNLSDTAVTDAGLCHLKVLSELQNLFVPRTSVTEVGVADLQKALPNCHIIR